MKDKYYTPAIEEFHVGFEYEYKERRVWKKDELGISDVISGNCGANEYVENGMDAIVDELEKCNIRVKHLDREDCISLGLKEKIWGNESGYFIIGDFTIGVYGTGLFCTVSQNDGGNKIMRFSGDLKNKSELKKILQQTNAL